MKALATTQRWIWLFRHQPLTIRLLAAAAALLTAAAAFAPPAEANQVDDDFVDALSNAGVALRRPGQRGGSGPVRLPDARQAGRDARRGGVKGRGRRHVRGMAGMFTKIAIQMYCPQVMANLASGNLSGLPRIPGVPGI